MRSLPARVRLASVIILVTLCPLRILGAATPPSITTQPLSQTVTAGQTAKFSLVASGSSLKFQWMKNGTNVSGATSASYTTPATTLADSGSQFTVVVSNSGGSVTSSAAALIVNPPMAPSITTQPASQTVNTGQTATFSVAVSGSTPLSYQWQKNGTAISKATAASYTTPATTASDNGSQFTVIVTNPGGSVASNPATLTVNVPILPSITAQPASQTVVVGQTATFTVSATGTVPLKFQWKKNGKSINGATSASYTTPATISSDNGSAFTVTISNSAGSVTSSGATLSVVQSLIPVISMQPVSQTVVAGQSATFSVTAVSASPLTYQWAENGVAISGAINSYYTTPPTLAADNNSQFAVVVTNPSGSVMSAPARLAVLIPGPLIPLTSQANFSNVNIGSSSSIQLRLTNTGSANVAVSGVTVSGPGFGASGLPTGQIFLPGESGFLTASFTPAATGGVAGSVSIASNAVNAPTSVVLSGTGVQASHSVALTWNGGAPLVTAYNVYRSSVSGGPYSLVTATAISAPQYLDPDVQSGFTYYYVVTALDVDNQESADSTEASASVPSP